MNLNLLLENAGSLSYLGNIISTEECIILHNTLLILQNENHFKEIFYWGKIYGVEKDYFIAYGYERDILTGQVFYYSSNCIDWGRLPQPSRNANTLSSLCYSTFQGKIFIL